MVLCVLFLAQWPTHSVLIKPIIQMSHCRYVAIVLGVVELLMTGGQTEKQDRAVIAATLKKENNGINLMVLYAR